MSRKSEAAPRRCGDDALALLGDLARLFAILAADRERQGPQAALGDLFAALEAVAEGVLLETAQRLLDLVERLGLHLDQRELDVVLDVRLGGLGRVEHAVRRVVRALAPDVPNLALHRAHDLAPALLEDVLQLRVTVPSPSGRQAAL